MIVDSSALLAVLFREEGFEPVLERLLADPAPAAGAPTLAETGIVLAARAGDASRGILERFLDETGIQEIPFGELHWREAVSAWRAWLSVSGVVVSPIAGPSIAIASRKAREAA